MAIDAASATGNIIANPTISSAPASRIKRRPNNVSAVISTEIPWLSLVVREDASWARLKFNELEYEFAGREFRANPYKRGAYNDNDN